MGFPRQDYWGGLPLPSPVDHVMSEVFIMTHLFWVTLHGTAHYTFRCFVEDESGFCGEISPPRIIKVKVSLDVFTVSSINCKE